MKKTVWIVMWIVIWMSTLVMCKKTVRVDSYSSKTDPKTLAQCDCTPPEQGIFSDCGANTVKCMKNFFNNGGFSRTYNVQWDCGNATTLYLCYNHNCQVHLIFYTIPPCLDCCIQPNKCYEGTPACGGHSMLCNFKSTDCRGVDMSIDLSGDPNITITCTDMNGNPYTVKGTLY